jgi:DNA-binding CsgD family transcriptional regulator
MEVSHGRRWWWERHHELHALTVQEFAAKHGCSVSTVCNWRAKLGIQTRVAHSGIWTTTRRKEVLVHLADWQSPADLARKLGVTRQTVHGYIERLLAMDALEIARIESGHGRYLYRLRAGQAHDNEDI